MAGLPENWNYSNAPAISNGASFVIPAAPGISHILTSIGGKFINLRGDGTNITALLQVIDSAAGTLFTWPFNTNSPAAGYDTDSYEDDLVVIGTPGATLQVRFAAGITNCLEAVSGKGYDL